MTESTDIAVTGLSCRFPGGDEPGAFWELLRAGRIGLTENPVPGAGDRYVPLRGVIADAFAFDAAFFRYSPQEALAMDPQHRVFLECAWRAMEDAGLTPDAVAHRVAVFAGCSRNTYHALFRLGGGAEQALSETFTQLLGSSRDFLATRVSFQLDLRGPSLDVQSACSTSLAAVTMACQSLADYTCDAALAGGVSIVLPQERGYDYEPGMIASPDGHCRAFDRNAAGCGFGNGAGVVVLRRLEDALAQRDHVHAVIRGFALNNDGSEKIGFTAPNARAQAAAIREALAMAQLAPADISYVETHGAGTAVGDPIEFDGLRRAFAGVAHGERCALGSVKANVGHLDAAAGIAGFIKTVLMLAHAELAPHPSFERPHEALAMGDSPFYVPTRAVPWPSGGRPRRAGVSSFGVGGTNAHVVLEEAPARPAPGPVPAGPFTLRLSARRDGALRRLCDGLAGYLDGGHGERLDDIEWSLRAGRHAHRLRLAVVARDRAEIAATLRDAPAPPAIMAVAEDGDRPVVFLLPGGGAQHPGMARALWAADPLFRRDVESAVDCFSAPLRDGIAAFFRDDPRAAAAGSTAALAALFSCCCALARRLLRDGLRADAMMGHSLGEYAVAHLCGVMQLDVAARLVEARGRLFESMPPGAMLSVSAPAEALDPWLGDGLYLAVINAPGACVVAGTRERVARLRAELEAASMACAPVHIDVASHCALVQPRGSEFERVLHEVDLQPPRVPYVTNVTGGWVDASSVVRPAHWLDHLTRPVLAAAGFAELLRDPRRIYLEVGPGQTMRALVQLNLPPQREGVHVFCTQPHALDGEPDDLSFARARAAVWVHGGRECEAQPGHARKVPLPTYPFARTVFRPRPVEPQPGAVTRDVQRMIYLPGWRPVPSSPPGEAPPGAVALIGGEGAGLARLESAFGREVRAARYALGAMPGGDADVVVVLLADRAGAGDVDQAIALLRDVARRERPARVIIDAPGAALLPGHPAPCPQRAMLRAACLTAAQENPGLQCCVVDQGADRVCAEEAAARLAAEAARPCPAGIVAWQGGVRFEPAVAPVAPALVAGRESRLVHAGAYLIAGGFGRVGRTLARWLAERRSARLGLLGRSPRRAPEDVALVEELRRAGAEVVVLRGDVTQAADVVSARDRMLQRFGRFDGVLHAAGVTSGPSVFRPFVDLEPRDWREQQHAKVQGVAAIDTALGDDVDPLRVLISSNATVLGGLGLAAYAGALAHAEALAAAARPRWRCITWDGWPRDEHEDRVSFGIDRYALDRAQAGAALDAALAQPWAPVLCVSAGDLQARARTWLQRREPVDEVAGAPADAPADVDDGFARSVTAPRSETERRVAAAWTRVLGLQHIDVHDSFFALGGHSLMATRLIAQLREEFDVELSLKSLFEGPTIAELATRIVEERALHADPEALESALAGLGRAPDA